MAITKLEDGRYRVQVEAGRTIDGGRCRTSAICDTITEAKRIERRESVRNERKGESISGSTTLNDYIERVFIPERSAVVTSETMRVYRSHLRNHVQPYIGTMRLHDIKKVHVQQVLSACKTRNQAIDVHGTLRNALQLACDLEIIDRNPAANRTLRYPDAIKDIRKDDGKNGIVLTSFSDIASVLDALKGDPAYPMAVVGLCFGLRKGEILGLDWERVDFERREIHIIQTYVMGEGEPILKEPKTVRSVRTIPMTNFAYGHMETVREMGGVSRIAGPVVADANGRRISPNSAYHIMEMASKRSGIPHITLFSMRHSFATSALKAGVEIATLSRWLGHSNTTTTYNRYVKPMMDDLRSDACKIDAAIGI